MTATNSDAWTLTPYQPTITPRRVTPPMSGGANMPTSSMRLAMPPLGVSLETSDIMPAAGRLKSSGLFIAPHRLAPGPLEMEGWKLRSCRVSDRQDRRPRARLDRQSRRSTARPTRARPSRCHLQRSPMPLTAVSATSAHAMIRAVLLMV